MASGVDLESIKEAYLRIKPFINHTPVHTSHTLDLLSGRHLFFKCEIFQKVGAFKFRGASNSVLKLSDEAARKGVVTHSSGNHAQALAAAAQLRNIPSHIVMPSNSPQVKKNAVELTYGAKVYLCEPTLQARETTCQKVLEETGGTFIHPFNNWDVIAGQGTIAYELLTMDMKDQTLDAIIVPIGGGGMISGICIAAKGINPKIRIFAAEPAGADDAKRSLETKQLQPSVNPKTVADGLLTSMGDKTWPIVRENVERVITVSEEEIIRSMRLVWERMKLVIEPSAAVGVAVALSSEFKKIEDITNVGIILCGGNVDLDRLPWHS